MRIPAPGAGESSPMQTRSNPLLWLRQQQSGPPQSDPKTQSDPKSNSFATTYVAIAIVLVVLIIATISYVTLRRLRRRARPGVRQSAPKGNFLTRIWRGWNVAPTRGDYRQGAQDDDTMTDTSYRGGGGAAGNNNNRRSRASNSTATLQQEQSQASGGGGSSGTTANAANNSSNATAASRAVDRNSSIRSIMTLPAYRAKARDTEQVLGVEGERDGIDMVVEFPRAEAEEESLREEEMDTLYQIRLARRRQIQEREERRRLRREAQSARERNDVVALEELQRQRRERQQQQAGGGSSSAEAAAAPPTAEEQVQDLRREHERIKETRNRAVSSVSYTGVGIARADGTRIRANSTESTERVGLLSDAASIGAASARSSSGVIVLPPNPPYGQSHRRERSTSSVLSIDSDLPSPGLSVGGRRSRAGSRPDTPSGRVLAGARNSSQSGGALAGSSPEMVSEADLGDAYIPPHSPPGYDEVSLVDGEGASTIGGNRSGATTPAPAATTTEPPPDYPGPSSLLARRASSSRRRSHSPVPPLEQPAAPTPAHLVEPQQQPHQAEMSGTLFGGHARRTSAGSPALVGEARFLERPEAATRGRGGVGGIPQLPSLRLSRLPQIVIEPSSARPGSGGE